MPFVILVALLFVPGFFLGAESLGRDQAMEISDTWFPSSDDLSAIDCLYLAAWVLFLSLFAHLEISCRGIAKLFMFGAIRVGLPLLLLSR